MHDEIKDENDTIIYKGIALARATVLDKHGQTVQVEFNVDLDVRGDVDWDSEDQLDTSRTNSASIEPDYIQVPVANVKNIVFKLIRFDKDTFFSINNHDMPYNTVSAHISIDIVKSLLSPDLYKPYFKTAFSEHASEMEFEDGDLGYEDDY